MRARLKKLTPPGLYNAAMLALPGLQRLPIVNYETNLTAGGLQDLFDLLAQVVNLDGDIIECGSSRCGTSVLMARHMRSLGVTKNVYALDSYEGFDPDEIDRERRLGLATAPDDAFKSTTFEYVTRKIDLLGYAGMVTPVKGFFEETLPGLVASTAYCFVFIDCDLEKSMRFCAETVWPTLQPGGIIAFDDYDSIDFKGARLAVDAFVSSSTEISSSEHGLLQRIYYVKKSVGNN